MTFSSPAPAGTSHPRDTAPNGTRGGVSGALRAAWVHRWFVLAVLALAGLALWQMARVLIGPEVAVDPVPRGTLVQTVVASGSVLTPYRVEIASQITGTVREVLVDDGQRVAKGQKLIEVENSELLAGVVQARGALAQAEARMRQLNDLTMPAAREQLNQARATLTAARNAFDRTSDLAARGFDSRSALDDARRALDVAVAQERAAGLQVMTAGPGGSDYVLAETQLAQARASLTTAQSRLSYATILAPRDGVLITRGVERGMVVQPGKALLVLAPDGDIQLQLQIDERNLGAIALGQHAVASADAYPDQKFDAVVSYINPGIDITRASVQVKLTVRDPPAYLRQDMTVSVDIEVARREATLILPVRDVHDALTATPWVLTVRDGRAVRQPVRLGLHGNTQVEILDGLGAGDVAIPALSGVLAGQRVRPVAR